MLELNKIYNMDCLEGMKQLDDNSVDLINTDPPFKFDAHGSGFIKKTKKKIFEKIDYAFGHDFNPMPFLNQCCRIMKKFNMYVWTSKENIPVYLNWSIKNEFKFNILTWHKLNPMPLWNNTYLPDTEYCIYIREKGAFFNSNLHDWRLYRRYILTNIGLERNGHPTPKPTKVIKPSILVSSKPNDLVLDPYMGSGTTAVICKQLNRNFIGFEINPKYIEIANKRLQQETLNSKLFKSTLSKAICK